VDGLVRVKPARWLLFGLPLAFGGAPGCAATAAPPAAGADPCAGRAPCAVAARHPAGGRLEVVQLELGPDPERGCPQVVWGRLGDGPPLRLLALCNDGYGASGVGEDSVEVKPGELIHSQYGGSAWRWSTTRRIGLSPHRLRHEEQLSHNMFAKKLRSLRRSQRSNRHTQGVPDGSGKLGVR
jgi:hypothetical protein